MDGVVVRPRSFIPKGTIFIVPNYEHPEIPMTEFSWGPGGLESRPAPTPDGRIIMCHPEDERRLRDALAIVQERPKWWEDWQRVERALRRVINRRTEDG